MRIGAAAAPCAGPALRVNKTPRAIWAVSEKGLKNEPEAVSTVSVHAARRKPMGLLVSIWSTDVFVSRRATMGPR